MKISRLTVSVTAEDIRAGFTAFLKKGRRGRALSDVSDPDVALSGGALVLSVRKKVGFVSVSLSAALRAKALPDGTGVRLTLDKVEAGVFAGGAAAKTLALQLLAKTLDGRPGVAVEGNDLIVTKDVLQAFPSLSIDGAVKSVRITSRHVSLVVE